MEPIRSREDLVGHVLAVPPKVDTTMARAFRRACGIRALPVMVASAVRSAASHAASDIAECFRNVGSPMDGRAGL